MNQVPSRNSVRLGNHMEAQDGYDEGRGKRGMILELQQSSEKQTAGHCLRLGISHNQLAIFEFEL